VHQNGRAGVFVQFAQAANVINVSVGAHNGFDDEPVAPQQIHDAGDFVAGIEHDGFSRCRIGNDGTIALKNPDGQTEMEKAGRLQGWEGFTLVHGESITPPPSRLAPIDAAQSARLNPLVMQQAATGSIIETPLATAHRDACAKTGVWFGCALPDAFGDWREEYRFARESLALIDKNYRAYVSFTGPDRARYLNAILTNNIKDLSPGRGVVSLFLSPQGHIQAEIETYAEADRLFCVSFAMIRESLVPALDKYIIMDDVTLTDETTRYGTLALEGPRAAAAARELSGVDMEELLELGWQDSVAGAIPCRVIRRSPCGAPSAEFLVEQTHLAVLWERLLELAKKHGGGAVGYTAMNALRLEQGTPWFGYDFGAKQIPHEAGLQDSHISYTKGCYTGQEIVERVRSRGQVNRVRVSLKFDAPAQPESGTPLLAEGKEVGFITRTAFSPALGAPIGMGYVRREKSAAGSTLDYTGGLATVIATPVG
jgi:folate-binding protein YgfZ